MKKKMIGLLAALLMVFTPTAALGAIPIPTETGMTDLVGRIPIERDEGVQWQYAMEERLPALVDTFTLRELYGGWAVSEAGRDLHVTTLGRGGQVLWIQAQIHGDERTASHGLLSFMWDYVNDEAMREAYKHLTICCIPFYNVDGSLLGQRGTQLIDDETGEAINKNYDLNRDWKLNLRGEGMGFLASETKAYYRLFCDMQPAWLYDLHNQGTKRGYVWDRATETGYRSDVDNMTGSLGIALAVNGPTLPVLLDGLYYDLTQQMQYYIYKNVHGKAEAFGSIEGIGTAFGIDQYAAGSNAEIYGSVSGACMLGLNYNNWNPDRHSCPGLFFESEGQTDGTVPYSIRTQKLAEQSYLVVHAFVEGFAAGKFLLEDPSSFRNPNSFPHIPYMDYSPDWNQELPPTDFSYLREPGGAAYGTSLSSIADWFGANTTHREWTTKGIFYDLNSNGSIDAYDISCAAQRIA